MVLGALFYFISPKIILKFLFIYLKPTQKQHTRLFPLITFLLKFSQSNR